MYCLQSRHKPHKSTGNICAFLKGTGIKSFSKLLKDLGMMVVPKEFHTDQHSVL